MLGSPLVKTTAYRAYKHHKALLSLHEKHSHPNAVLLSLEKMPKHGIVAYSSTDYIAMGFLRLIEGGYAQIDTLVSNPDCSPELRHRGISLVVDELIKKAKDLGLKSIISYTKDLSTVIRAEAIGFQKAVDYSIIILPLS